MFLYEKKDWDGTFNPSKKYGIWSGSSYVQDLIVSGDIIHMCYHSGDCDEDIARCLELPEIKSQTDKITDDALNEWWDEFFCDDEEEEHRCANRERKLSWLLFDCCANAIDGYCEELD